MGKASHVQGKAWVRQGIGKCNVLARQGIGKAGHFKLWQSIFKARLRQGKSLVLQGNARHRQGKVCARQGMGKSMHVQCKALARQGLGKARHRQGKAWHFMAKLRQGKP
jgi:hypothetical protein